MSAVDEHCAVCVAKAVMGDLMVKRRPDEKGTIVTVPLSKFDDALTARAEDQYVFENDTGCKVGLYAATSVYGTPVCEDHTPYLLMAQRRDR